MCVAVGYERLAVDVFEGEKRLPLGGDSGVVQPCDMGMSQCREDVALAAEALGKLHSVHTQMRKLQCHRSLEHSIGALRQPHGAHPATSQLAKQAVRSYDRA